MKRYLARGMILLASVCAFAQNPYGNQLFGPVVMTATSQTSAPVPLGNSWSSIAIQLTGNNLTTATFGALISTDNGTHYFAVPICTSGATPSCATTQTATADGLYTLVFPGITQVKFVTSSTFTGTSISLLLTASPNSTVSKNSSGGGGGSTITCAASGGIVYWNGSSYVCSTTLTAQSAVLGSPSAAAIAALPSGSHGFSCDETSTPGVPASAVDYLRCDAATHQILVSQNDGSEIPIVPINNGSVLIQRQTLGAAASTITFTSIPNTYHDLTLRCEGRGDTGADTNVLLTFNGDSSGDYDLIAIYGTGPTSAGNAGSVAVYGGSSLPITSFPGPSANANYPGNTTVSIFDYAGTTFFKSMIVLFGNIVNTSGGQANMQMDANYWRSTSAITSITLTSSAGNFVAGSNCAIYGNN